MIYIQAALFLWAFWYAYILVMGLYRAFLAKRLTPLTTALGLPALIVGGAMDVFCNLTIAIVVFRDPPQEWLVTARLKRYQEEGGWRQKWADWICTNLLDPFDPNNNHC